MSVVSTKEDKQSKGRRWEMLGVENLDTWAPGTA